MACHPPLREGGGPGPQLPGRLHQPGQCAQGGYSTGTRSHGTRTEGKNTPFFCPMHGSLAS